MKKSIFPVFLVICLFITFFSCSNKSKNPSNTAYRVTFTPDQKEYPLGSNIAISINTKLNGNELNKIEIFNGDELLASENKPSFSFELKNLSTLGPNTIKVVTTKKDGKSNIRCKYFNVLSDIEPSKNTFELIKEYPHSVDNFTEGLLMHDGFLYEGTGEPGTSFIYKTILNTGKVVLKKVLDKKYFGEGITILNNKVFQLTYKTKIGFVYKLPDMALIDSFKIKSEEGWGLTNDGTNLIMSDGTSKLTWIDPNTYQPVRYSYVADNKNLQEELNELEFTNGSIFANVWMKNYIVEIDPKTGRIISTTDLSKLFDKVKSENNIDVLNGIAYLENNDDLLVTGKYWPKIFEIKLIKPLVSH
jgi:glutaminyl-peptide cyclotransferase